MCSPYDLHKQPQCSISDVHAELPGPMNAVPRLAPLLLLQCTSAGPPIPTIPQTNIRLRTLFSMYFPFVLLQQFHSLYVLLTRSLVPLTCVPSQGHPTPCVQLRSCPNSQLCYDRQPADGFSADHTEQHWLSYQGVWAIRQGASDFPWLFWTYRGANCFQIPGTALREPGESIKCLCSDQEQKNSCCHRCSTAYTKMNSLIQI